VVSSYGIQALPIAKALELYDILGKYLPEFSEDTHILDFVGTIVDNIVEDKSDAYVEALCLMLGKDVPEVISLSSEERLKLFSIGLSVNDISNLKMFCEDVSYGR